MKFAPTAIPLASLVFVCNALAQQAFRPPAVPLVTSDPYLSVWSPADKLTDANPRHWTRKDQTLSSLIRIDGKTFRLMGKDPAEAPAFPQARIQVLPTRTIYDFDDGHIHVAMTFTTPALPDDLNALARPVTYLTWDIHAVDAATHDVAIYQSTSSQLAVLSPDQIVRGERTLAGDLTSLRLGTINQPVLGRSGDDTRIDWGFIYTAAPISQTKSAIGPSRELAGAFTADGSLPDTTTAQKPTAVRDNEPVLAFAFAPFKAAAETVSRHVLIAYDEIFSIKYFGKKLKPFWARDGITFPAMLQEAEAAYSALQKRCAAFDAEMMADLTEAGGSRYAQIAALSYRQALAGCGLAADANKQPLLFTKENTSNGCIATVDVIYPAAPQFLLMGPTYAKALVAPAMIYGASARWKFPFAPHDLGTYPNAGGQAYAGGENSKNEGNMMPVEESANLILLCDAIAHMEGNADFAGNWWPQLTRWEAYLEKFGLDPENQLCTDDFMGHLAHNSNLSVKAILAIASYGDLCKMRGDATAAAKFTALAREDARHWIESAKDGDHYRIAFDKPNTWSQKYNLVWDSILGLNIFPPQVAKQEVAYYKTVMQKYGVPLDSRTKLTKTDWSIWCATLADNRADFEAIVSPIWDYLNETTVRDPLADSYTTDNIKSGGMHARPVMGGAFIKLLANGAVWKKWAARDQAKVGNWAPLPTAATITEIVPTSRRQPILWRYTTEKPADNWAAPDFDASSWKEGAAGFGSRGTPGAVIGTEWRTADIWIRREFTFPADEHPHLQLLAFHDEDIEIYLNGLLAGHEPGYNAQYVPIEISDAARALLKPGAKITLAAHCHQTVGGQGIDVGLADVVEAK